MPQDNLETIRRGHEAFSRGDLSWVKQFVNEGVDWRPTGTFPGLEDAYRGPEALDRWMETIRAEWSEFEVSLVELIRDEGDDLLIVERLWGRGRESGAEVEMPIYSIYRFDAGGKITERLAFTTREQALEAFEARRRA